MWDALNVRPAADTETRGSTGDCLDFHSTHAHTHTHTHTCVIPFLFSLGTYVLCVIAKAQEFFNLTMIVEELVLL